MLASPNCSRPAAIRQPEGRDDQCEVEHRAAVGGLNPLLVELPV